MCQPRDIYPDMTDQKAVRRFRQDLLFWACVFAVLLAAVAGYEATQDLRERSTAPAKIAGCSTAKFEKVPGALSPGQTVYHVTGCPGAEYWLIRSAAQK